VSTRAVVLLPTATDPAMPITYGTAGAEWPRNVEVTAWSAVRAVTWRSRSRISGR
jgi:hypothetical protein